MNILLTKEGDKGLIKQPSEVDKYIKTTVVGDAIRLMRSKKHRADRAQIAQLGCWKRILPSEDATEYQMFAKAKYLYEKIVNRKGSGPMSLTCFGKLSKIKPLRDRLTRVQLDLLYKRLIQTNKVSQMDLNTFFDALEELANVLYSGQLARCDALIEVILANIGDLKPQATQKPDKNYMTNTANRRIAEEQKRGTYTEQ